MAFTGFSKNGVVFFRQLAVRQDRDWFKAHKDEYAALWEAPLKALLEEIGPAISRQYRGIALEKPKVFRIYRDVRFSKDKSPFKTNVAAVFSGKGGFETGAPAALYMHLGLEDTAWAGHWSMQPGQLANFRKVVLDPKRGPELRRRLAVLTKKGFEVDSFESLKRVPKGFDPEHPGAELLKLKGFGLTFPKIPPAVRFKPALAKWMVDRSAEAAGLVTWLHPLLSK